MAALLFDELLLPSGCHMVMLEMGTDIGGIPPLAPQRMPAVRFSSSGVAVLTRCEDSGKVQMVVWAGDPGPPPTGWRVVFEGDLETKAKGFDAGTATASLVHVNADPGMYRVRAEARRDANGEVDGVRFIFPNSPNLDGQKLW
jgi:hypothetical protein